MLVTFNDDKVDRSLAFNFAVFKVLAATVLNVELPLTSKSSEIIHPPLIDAAADTRTPVLGSRVFRELVTFNVPRLPVWIVPFVSDAVVAKRLVQVTLCNVVAPKTESVRLMMTSWLMFGMVDIVLPPRPALSLTFKE